MDELLIDVHHDNNNIDNNVNDKVVIPARQIYDYLPIIKKYNDVWSNKDVAQINEFAKVCREAEKIFEMEKLCEAIAVVDRANELATGGHKLRAPQILSVLVFLNSTTNYRGKLCQIESGEG